MQVQSEKQRREAHRGLLCHSPVTEARAVNACTCPSNSWILSWAPDSLCKPSPQHMGHCFSDKVTPFISGDPTSVVVVNVEVAVAVADMTGGLPRDLTEFRV